MILGRPANLALAALTGVLNVIVLVLAALEPPIVIPAVVVGAVNLGLAAVIAFVAYQPPTLNPGDTFVVTTPPGTPNAVTTVATPPAADPPPVPTTGG